MVFTKMVRYHSILLYECNSLNSYTIQCFVRMNKLQFPTHLAIHFDTCRFAFLPVILNKNDKFTLKDNDEFLELKIDYDNGTTSGWIDEPQLLYEEFWKLKQYLI